MVEVLNRFEYEIERLKEIYSCLFPGQTVAVFIKPESDMAHEHCREINLSSAHDLLSISKFHSEMILVGDPGSAPSRAFLVTADVAHAYDNARTVRHLSAGYKDRFKSVMRSFLSRFPIIYEVSKSIYFSRKK